MMHPMSVEIRKSQPSRFPDSHRHDYDEQTVLMNEKQNNNPDESVTHVSGLNCYLSPGTHSETNAGILRRAQNDKLRMH